MQFQISIVKIWKFRRDAIEKWFNQSAREKKNKSKKPRGQLTLVAATRPFGNFVDY